MLEALSNVLELIIQPCYALTGNWWVAIFLFTVISKVILMPISLWCQKNALLMVQMMPELNGIKAKYFGDRETIEEKQTKLYKERHYHPLLSLIPLAVQILILFGLIDVVHSIADSGVPGTEQIGIIPFFDGGAAWIWPFLAGGSAMVLCWFQNRINPLQREQTRAEQNGTNALSIVLALVLGVFVAAGLAFYWICSNLTAVLVQFACNLIMPPKKYIDYEALEKSKAELAALDELEGNKRKWYQRDPEAKREKADYKRFFSVSNKHLVFYSEGSGFYKYYEGMIRWILSNSSGVIHYVTNDPNDQVFELSQSMPRLIPYYIGQKRAITLMMKMDADVVVTTLYDLDTYYIKRSYVKHDIEYICVPHHMTSCHLVSSKTSFFNYDTILCTGPHQVRELKRMGELYQLRKQNLIEAGCSLIDAETAAYEESERTAGAGKPATRGNTILIAPSWQEDSILDTCITDIIDSLLEGDWHIIVRPHPEYTKRYWSRWEALQERYNDAPSEKLYFERDFSSNETIWTSDILVTDWSSVGCEFSFATLKPCIFVNTPMKVHNPDWEELGIIPTDISLRDTIGVSVDPQNANSIGTVADNLISTRDDWKNKIEDARAGFIFNLGNSAQICGEYVLNAVLKAQAAHEEE